MSCSLTAVQAARLRQLIEELRRRHYLETVAWPACLEAVGWDEEVNGPPPPCPFHANESVIAEPQEPRRAQKRPSNTKRGPAL